MSQKEALFELIKAMTKAEKRHFRLEAAAYSGEKNYLRLFDAIEKQKNYREDKLLQKFSGEKFIRHLASEKHYLHQALVRSLVRFHDESSILSKTRSLLAGALVLFDKAQKKPSWKMLCKAKKLAEAGEFHSLLLNILDAEELFIDEFEQAGLLEEIIGERNRLLAVIANRNEYLALLSRFAGYIREHAFARSAEQQQALERMMQDPLLSSPGRALSLTALQSYYEIWCNYATILSDHAAVKKHLSCLVAELQKNPLYTDIYRKDYSYILSNLSVASLLSGDPDGAMRYNGELKKLRDKIKDKDLHLFRMIEMTAFENDIRIAAATSHFREILKNIRRIQKTVSLRQNPESPMNSLLRFHGALALFIHNREKEALRLIQPIIDEQKIAFKGYNMYAKAFILRMLIHFESGHIDTVEQQRETLARILERHKKTGESEKILLGFFRGLTFARSQKELKKSFAELYRQLHSIMHHPYEQAFLRNMDFLMIWLISQSAGITKEEAATRFAAEKAIGGSAPA